MSEKVRENYRESSDVHFTRCVGSVTLKGGRGIDTMFVYVEYTTVGWKGNQTKPTQSNCLLPWVSW